LQRANCSNRKPSEPKSADARQKRTAHEIHRKPFIERSSGPRILLGTLARRSGKAFFCYHLQSPAAPLRP
jgi:hypothetical protein